MSRRATIITRRPLKKRRFFAERHDQASVFPSRGAAGCQKDAPRSIACGRPRPVQASARHELRQRGGALCPAYALPIKIPAASTSPPPNITLATAESGGVSMKRHWIQAIAASSNTTTMAATMVAVTKCGMR